MIDTGRHREHTKRIVEFAKGAKKPIQAIVNTHWHLDHVGGNPRLRGEFPQVRVHASDAIRGAMTGFLARYRTYLEGALAKAGGDAGKKGPLRAELAILDAGEALFSDEPVTAAGTQTIAGRTLEIGLEKGAVTAGDVWVFDSASRVLVAGDLVTLPAPFLDTACPARWRQSLERLAQVPFKLLVPGHRPALTPTQFASYRRAFGGLLDCAASARKKEDCASPWLEALGGLVPTEDHALTRSLLGYYFDAHLRADPAKRAALCAVADGG